MGQAVPDHPGIYAPSTPHTHADGEPLAPGAPVPAPAPAPPAIGRRPTEV
jgi:hypothetical protein